MYARIQALDRPFGREIRTLLIGGEALAIEGLDRDLARVLERRWGGFLQRRPPLGARRTVRVYRAAGTGWLPHWSPGEHYRIEADGGPEQRVVASYYFGVAEEPGESGAWRLGLTEGVTDEPVGRTLDNALRFLTAALALDLGGFAMHSAGVLRGGHAYVLLGPSGAGKTTATELLAATSLGDDFGIVLPVDGRWVAPALPFDNSECISHEPPKGLFPVAGIFRLRHAPETRVEHLPLRSAISVLMGGVAFAWAFPERAGELLDNVQRFVVEGRFRELHFTRDADLWPHLEPRDL